MMATKKKKDDGKRKLVNKVMWNTSIEVPTKEPNFHSLRLRGKEVDLSCSTKAVWTTLYPITDITKDICFCPTCGQQLVSEVLFDKLKGVMPQTTNP
jgi:hypothetical protein